MNLGELITEARRLADDTALQPLYDDTFMAQAASEAEREACVRARLLFDDSSEFLSHAIAEGTATFELDLLVDVVDHAILTPTGDGCAHALDLTGIDRIRDQDPTYRCSGKPLYLAQVGRACRIWPKASAGYVGTLTLAVYRLPLNALEENDDEPEIHEQHHMGLVHWILHKAYMTKDGEQGDADRSEMHLSLFEAQFGKRPDADAKRRQQERRRISTRYGGIR